MPRWVYGKHTVLERLRLPKSGLEYVVLAKGMDKNDAEEVQQAANAAKLRVEWKDRGWLDTQSEHGKHQGVMAPAEPFKYSELTDIIEAAGERSLVVMLDSVEDPYNLGAVLRSAECAGATGVIIPKDRAVQVTPIVEKASAGAAGLVRLARVTNLSQVLDELKEAGFWSYGLAGEAKENLYDQKFSGKVCLVLGAEGEGLRPLVAKNCDKLVKIPLQGSIESLNVSVTAGIAMFEVLRRRG